MLQKIKIFNNQSIFLKLMLSFILVLTLSVFSACSSDDDDDEGSPAVELGDTLTLTGTITHIFDVTAHNWTETYAHPGGMAYHLISTTGGVDDGTAIDTDNGDTAELNLTTGAPAAVNMLTSADWGFTSSSPDVKLYSAEVNDDNDESIYEGNFDIAGRGYAEWYEYIYADGSTTLSGSVVDGTETYIFNNISLSEGWNKVRRRTADGSTFNYYGGAISDPVKWTFMLD
ncbi:MAG: hypothetical protein JW864_17955 [Spirochaetes bacterium]|nr:hypothetical protein [Spirochaetota bacterium]